MRVSIKQGGYIALISAVIIGSMLMSLALSEGLALFYSNAAALDYEYGHQAESNALACVGLAALWLGEDPGFMLDASRDVPEDSCAVLSIARDGDLIIVITTASVFGINRKVSAIFSSTDLSATDITYLQ